jgi:hypothetical protein
MGGASNMDKFKFSSKHMAISKTNAQTVAAVGIASFITIFCLVATKTLYGQYQYQSHVIKAENTADTQLQSNISAYKSLVSSYTSFDNTSKNVLGNPVTGPGNDNTHVILDALPSEYDFPGLISTVENILNINGVNVTDVTGTDAQTNQTPASSGQSATYVAMPFGFTVSKASYGSIQQLIQSFQQSIRPFPIDSIAINVSQDGITMLVAAHSYYQPTSSLSITQETIK